MSPFHLVTLLATLALATGAPFSLEDWRVSGGQRARLGQFPFAVWINLGGSVCSGSILNANTVLTAAHCTQRRSPGQLTVYAGMTTRSDRTISTHKVNAIYVNPGYRGSVNGEDVSVVKLSNSIRFDSYRQPINLGSASDVPSIGSKALFAGFGAPRVGELFWAQLTVTQCIGYQPKAVCLTRSPSSTEGGDSGGPLFVTRGGRNYQIGVNSGAITSGSRRTTLQARVDKHLSYIKRYM